MKLLQSVAQAYLRASFDLGRPLSDEKTLFWAAPGEIPPAVREALGPGWRVVCADAVESSGPVDTDLAILWAADETSSSPPALAEALGRLNGQPLLAVLPEGAETARNTLRERGNPCVLAGAGASAGELAARLDSIGQLSGRLQNGHETQELSPISPERARELNEDLKLAARLQRDFLPRRLPEVGPARFGVLFQPASFVSGDIYDVTRLDEDHVGFYIADAVGHGLPAALLTMFIKKGLQTKRISGHSYHIVPPGDSLRDLNVDICAQNLSSCQFCTAVYGVLNARTGEATIARAGHPEPLLLRADGSSQRVEAPGTLLGVLPEEEFPATKVRLAPGDRLLIYSDGAEPVLFGIHSPAPDQVLETLAEWADLPREDLMLRVAEEVDALVGGKNPDDVTVMVLDYERD
jgi:sigma-B regulation protein RsbU (phosphoserine phosphatase)